MKSNSIIVLCDNIVSVKMWVNQSNRKVKQV